MFMFPGLGGMNPAQMQRMMSQMGIKTQEMSVEKIIFQMKDGTKFEMNLPQVTKMTIKGTDTYQVVGNAVPIEDEKRELFNEDDVKMVMEQADCSRDDAQKMLKETKGDIAEAIMKLK